jgi:hypothetical protein
MIQNAPQAEHFALRDLLGLIGVPGGSFEGHRVIVWFPFELGFGDDTIRPTATTSQ